MHVNAQATFSHTLDIALRLPNLNKALLVLSTGAERQEFYQNLQRLGLEYGLRLQVVEKIWQFEQGFIGQIQLREHPEVVSPILLEGCLQVTAYMIQNIAQQKLYIPIKLKQLQFIANLTSRVYCYCTWAISPELSSPQLALDIAIFNVDGRLAVRLCHWVLQRFDNHELEYPRIVHSEQLFALIKDIAGFTPDYALEATMSFEDLGYDSLMYLQLSQQLGDMVGINLTPIELAMMSSMAELLTVVQTSSG